MKNYKKNKKILEKSFNYSPEMEHDACGVGLIASTNGKKSRKIVEYGIEALKAELTSLVNIGALSNNETIVSNSRHFEALNNALTAILSVQEGIDLEISTDLFSIDIRECLRHLGNITGEYDVDKDILGHIFGNFCIGK